MKPLRKIPAVVLPLLIGTGLADVPQPPGPSLPARQVTTIWVERLAAPSADPTTLWDVGAWTDSEQLVLERVNRSRANPLAETDILRQLPDPLIQFAYSFFLVDFGVMKTDMATYGPQPPLAPHRLLLQSARGHSQWMLANASQSHFQGTLDILDRVLATTYPVAIVGENLYAAAEGPEYAHAGLEVDWGYPGTVTVPTPPGMQEPPGHRINNHDARFREAGVGVVYGRNSRNVGGVTETVGPELYTINFGARPGATPMVTGVAYFDLDSNQQYDVGEGISGVRIEVSDSSYHGVTSPAGGYAVPTANGSRTVAFSAPGMATDSRILTVSGGNNIKSDLRLNYTPPPVTGSASPAVGQSNGYLPAVVPAATAYDWSVGRRVSTGGRWTAEQSLDRVLVQVTPGYDVRTTTRRATGAYGYRLTTPQPVDQVLTLDGRFIGGSSPALSFSIALGYATEDQTIYAESSDDGGVSWKVLWRRSGITGQSDGAFSRVTLPLPAYAERDYQVRFRYSVGLGPYYNTVDAGEGAYLDDIELVDSFKLNEVSTGRVAAGSPVNFTPAEIGEFVLAVRPLVGSRLFPQGPRKVLNAVVGPPVIRLGRPVVLLDGRLELGFTATGGTSGTFVLERSSQVGVAWTAESGATLTTVGAGNYLFRVPVTGDRGLYRIRVP